MAIQLTGVTVIVNNETIGIVPNTLMYTEGFGEQKLHVVSVGGGAVEQVYANDLETNFSIVGFEIRSTVDNLALARNWKINGNENVILIQGENSDGQVIRTFSGAALLNNYEVGVGVDATLTIEFGSRSAT